MKSTGMLRKVDDLGRIVLPKELRDNLEINSADSIEIFTDGGRIVLQKYAPGCCFCGNLQVTKMVHEKKVCRSCVELIGGR
ncbi:AbrB/MazE/SpoVT family DNA-binding domain-containing protein [Paenibacillus sp. RUD330]|nr:AbrB/MazE/SpoVT family DNA-binding domain-containing protein [Paenibacillus sp. RUD330]